MLIYCPACDAPNADASKSCEKCGASTHLDDRYVLRNPAPAASGEDVVDRAATLRLGLDVEESVDVTIRIATIGMAARVHREATILNGLRDPRVPQVVATTTLDGVGTALVLTSSPFPTLEAQVAKGLRLDDTKARALIGALLDGLRVLHRVSPPVFHRNLHPGTVAWDGGGAVHFLDFARATDTVVDAETDGVAARTGYSPQEEATPAQHDLYGIAATVAHVLSRRDMADLPRKRNGAPDIRPAIVVSDEVELFLERLLHPSDKEAPVSLEEAVALWERCIGPKPLPSQTPKTTARLGLAIAAATAIMAVSMVGYFVVASDSPPPKTGRSVTTTSAAPPSKEEPTPLAPRGPPPVSVKTSAPPVSKVPKARRSRTKKRPPPPSAPSPSASFKKKLSGAKSALMACDDPAPRGSG